jgi:alcohol dehydrogenase (NADP+)
MIQSTGYAAFSAEKPLGPFDFDRREPKPQDIVIDIEYCGICHSDLHFVENDMGMTTYPVVPGHEIVGRVSWVGSDVSRFKVGDLAGVGCYIDSCRTCEPCTHDKQHMCVEGMTGSFGGVERDGKTPTYGGFSNNYVVNADYALKMHDDVDLAASAPLLCAGITTWSPLKKWNVGPGQKVGIVGLGGLGHMAVKLATALGADVYVFTTSASKRDDARALGAKDVILSTDATQMAEHSGSFNFILDTVAAEHDVNGYIDCLKPESTLCLLGIVPQPLPVASLPLVFGQKCVVGSLIGGLQETQDMIDFCADHGITADIELIPLPKVNEAFDRLHKNDVRYRFVLDMSELNK